MLLWKQVLNMDDGAVTDLDVYNLLFSECDEEKTGWVNVDALINYVRQVLPQSVTPEQNSDPRSHGHGTDYNLELLRGMLNTMSVEGSINEVSYLYAIEKWVNNVRNSTQSPSLVKISVKESDSEDDGPLPFQSSSLLQESFETTGGSSYHDTDPTNLMNTIGDLQVDNRKLKDRNHLLLQQIESLEENIRQLQFDHQENEGILRCQQQSLALLDDIKLEKTELTNKLTEYQSECSDQSQTICSMQHNLQDQQNQISELQNELTLSHNRREELSEEMQKAEHFFKQKEDRINELRDEFIMLESKFEIKSDEAQSLQHALCNAKKVIEELKLDNSCLLSQLSDSQPLYSTPLRNEAPSLHDELAESGMAHDMSSTSLTDLMSSLSEVEEDNLVFKNALSHSKAKFDQRAKQVHHSIDELLDISIADKSLNLSYEKKMDDTEHLFEAKRHKIGTSRTKDCEQTQKLFEEIERLKRENTFLKNKYNEMNMNTVTERDIEFEAIESTQVLSDCLPIDMGSEVMPMEVPNSEVTDASNTYAVNPDHCNTPMNDSRVRIDKNSLSNVVSVSAQTESSFLKNHHLQFTKVTIENVAPLQVNEKCVSFMLLFGLKISAVFLMILLLVLSVFIAFVSVNSSFNRCGGRQCSQSFLHMLLGQNVLYKHDGDVAL